MKKPTARLDRQAQGNGLRIIEGILHSAVEFNDFRKLVVQPTFPHQNIQQSGMLMYQQAYTIIEELDGKMR